MDASKCIFTISKDNEKLSEDNHLQVFMLQQKQVDDNSECIYWHHRLFDVFLFMASTDNTGHTQIAFNAKLWLRPFTILTTLS